MSERRILTTSPHALVCVQQERIGESFPRSERPFFLKSLELRIRPGVMRCQLIFRHSVKWDVTPPMQID